ncbi:hypothetical protein [Corynebacterium sp.]|uniref:hypothetical protein n=1 Tax=Corynebacterium sp. TaxID=1720 RepID=UPI0026DC4321|nr:hypothetical protein [Corynebacterium sp.]MDO4915974.1 hypothetical protein [Corynebacterium sp.]
MNLAGIYFVLGDLESDEENLYIGKAAVRKNNDGTLKHVLENMRNGKHLFCRRVAMLVSRPESFTATELGLMEDAFITLAREAGRTHMSNGTGAHAGRVGAAQMNRIGQIVSNTRLMLATMGIMILETPLPTEEFSDVALGENEDAHVESRGPAREVSNEFYSHRRKENRATLVRSGSEWVLKKGSWLLQAKTEHVAEERARHARLIDGDVTVGDIPFTSPNKAGVFVNGNAANARTFWKDENGRTLGEYIENGEI